MIRKLSAEKDRLASQGDAGSVNSVDSEVTDAMSSDDDRGKFGSPSVTSSDDLGSLKQLLGFGK